MLLPDTVQCEKKGREQQGVGAGGSGNGPDSLQDPTVCLLLVIKYQEEKRKKKGKNAPSALTTPQPRLGKEIAEVLMGGVSPQPHHAWLASADTVQLEMPTSQQSKGNRSRGGGEDDDNVFHICKCIRTRYPEGDKTKRPQRGWLRDAHKARYLRTPMAFACEDLRNAGCDAAQRFPPSE